MIRVLVVDDDPVAAEINVAYVSRVDGFESAGSAGTLADAILRLRADPGIQLVLLDLSLPDGSGLSLLRKLRAAGVGIDVLVISADRELSTVREAAVLGVVGYLVKPFAFASFAEKLARFADYRSRVADDGAVSQHDVDEVFALLRPGRPEPLPKGLSTETLASIVAALRAATVPLSAAEVGALTATSRITARRYLEHLASTQAATREQRYGTPGRPEILYRWAGSEPPAG
jgi:response regulator of citrate/malate metabolism